MNDVNLELYKAFYYVVKEKNLTNAAKKMFISQPAVTQSIKKLEQQLDVLLFYRTKSGMELTKEGLLLWKELEPSIKALIQSKNFLDNSKKYKKVIKICGGTSILRYDFLSKIKEFIIDYPDVFIKIMHEPSDIGIEMLENQMVDLVALKLPRNYSENILMEEVMTLENIFIATPDLVEKYGIDFNSDTSLSFPFILQSEIASTRNFFDSICRDNKIQVQTLYELHSYGLTMDFIKNGIGIGFLDKSHIKEELESGKLIQLKTNFTVPKRTIGIATNKASKNDTILHEFVRYLKEK